MGGDDDDGGGGDACHVTMNRMMHRRCNWDRGFDHSFIAMREFCNIDRPCVGLVGMWFAVLCFVIRTYFCFL